MSGHHPVASAQYSPVVTSFGWYGSRQTPGLFHSTDISALRAQHPDNAMLHDVSESSRTVVSEPLGDLRGAWPEILESTCVVVHDGEVNFSPFAPAAA